MSKAENAVTKAYTIVLPLPHKHLSPNGRAHWRAKAAQTAIYRAKACGETGFLFPVGVRPRWKRATLLIRAFYPVKRNRDDDNLIGSLKSARDGLVDGGLMENDKGFTTLPVEWYIDRTNPRIELVVTKQD